MTLKRPSRFADLLVGGPRYQPIVAGLGATGVAVVAFGYPLLGLAISVPSLLAALAFDQRARSAAWHTACKQARSQVPWFNAPERADALVALEQRFGRRSRRAMRALRRDLDVSDHALQLARRRAAGA